ncbi:MAG: peptide ABC transporter substrate-binding protein [Woeseiaceae bacterium]
MKRSLLLVLFLCLSLAGCGDRDAAIESDGVLHRGNGAEPESLDVHKTNSTEAGHVQRDLGEGLVGYTPEGNLRPTAAEDWEVSANGTEYTFALRPHARWSNGDPVTAEDFVYSYRRLVDPATAALYTDSVNSIVNAAAILRGEASPDTIAVEAVGTYELKITLTQPVPYFLALLAHPSMYPVHRPSIEEHRDQHARPGNLVSNGAYRLVTWEVGSYIEIERNEHYWDDGSTSIDRVRHYVTPQPMVELNRYRAGELDITRTIPPELFAEMKDQRPDEVRVSSALGIYYYGFNLEKEPFASNAKLRQALSLAIDRDVIVSLVGRGEQAAYSWVPPGTANYDPQLYSWSRMSQEERKRRAQQLYEEAGFGRDEPLTLEVRYNTNETHRQIAVAIQSMWKGVLGVNVELVNEDLQVLLSNVQVGNMEVFRLSWNGDYNDAHTFLTQLESGHSSNFTQYSSDEYDDLMARAARQVDPSARKLFLEDAERLALRDYPLIPIYFYINRSMVSPRVSGWGDNVLNYHYSQHLSLAVDD